MSIAVVTLSTGCPFPPWNRAYSFSISLLCWRFHATPSHSSLGSQKAAARLRAELCSEVCSWRLQGSWHGWKQEIKAGNKEWTVAPGLVAIKLPSHCSEKLWQTAPRCSSESSWHGSLAQDSSSPGTGVQVPFVSYPSACALKPLIQFVVIMKKRDAGTNTNIPRTF